MLNARVMHLDSATQMLDLGHDIEVPIDVPHWACRMGVTPIVLEELLAFLKSGLVVANNF